MWSGSTEDQQQIVAKQKSLKRITYDGIKCVCGLLCSALKAGSHTTAQQEQGTHN